MEKSNKQEQKIDQANQNLWSKRFSDSEYTVNQAIKNLAHAIKIRYSRGIAYAKLNIAAVYFLQSKNNPALKNLTDSLRWFTSYPSEQGFYRALNLKSNLYEGFGEYEKALSYSLQALKLSADAGDRDNEAEACSQLGLIYSRLSNFSKSLEYFNKGLKIREDMGDENAVASSFNRIGMVLRQMRRYEKSLEYYYKSLEIRRKNNQIGSITWTMLGIASTYEEMKRLPEALDFYNHGMTGGDKRCTLQCLSGSGRIYSLLGNASSAEESLKKSLSMARELKAPALVAEAYLGLANHYETTGNTIKALKNHKLYHKTRETVQSDEAQNRLRNVEISYAVEKSEQEKEIYRLKNVELKYAYDLIDEINKEITAGINYASRIQRAMLSNPSQIRGLTNKYFILYLPKEIVSGDFYWFNRLVNKLIIVAGDCTGHGVPGALMSMLGISFLEEIVNFRGIKESGKVLDELRKEVRRALKQEGKKEDVKDGMDISICVIDRDKKTLQYSGANNNLYLVRKNELIEYSADRMPIGAADIGDNNYKSTDIDIYTGDIIYMFSDGYADQSGGPNRKKYKYSVLKTFLLSIHNLPMQKQKQMLEKGFYDWKGINPQRDDILIMGLKI